MNVSPRVLSSYRAALLSLAAMSAAFIAFATSVAPATADAPAPGKSTAKFETRFMESMIDHHAMAIEMGEVCVEKAVHDELRAMCQNIVATQSTEIEDMQSWLADWYGARHEPQMKRGDMRQMERLQALSGSEFEIEFMQQMIRHHQMAIREAGKCLDRAYHSELLQLCQNIIESQAAEIRQLQAWLCEWYGECRRRKAA